MRRPRRWPRGPSAEGSGGEPAQSGERSATLAEVVIVGAGLAGLVAAVNCARAGHEVRVLEKRGGVGGDPTNHPSVESTPMEPERLGDFLGVELVPPHVTPVAVARSYAYGRRYEMEKTSIELHAVERGSRPTSIENYLYGLAAEEGVEFEFGWELRSRSDLEQLPPGSIIATGLSTEPFRVLAIPYKLVYGYVSNASLEGEPRAVAYFGEFTRDYCYMANANGIAYALFFDRSRKAPRDVVDAWAERLLADEGTAFEEWRFFDGAVAVKTLDNPRLFVGDRIIAGTLASMNDPLFLFGVHASLMSGKIAATAVDDRPAACELYRRVLSFYRKAWMIRRLMDSTPSQLRRLAMRLFFATSGAIPDLHRKLMFYQIPGLREV